MHIERHAMSSRAVSFMLDIELRELKAVDLDRNSSDL